MIINKGLSHRSDRKAIPLPFGTRGGILLHPSHVRLDCLYGIDGGTYRLDNPSHPGCSDTFCQSGPPCGFSGSPATAWAPADMGALLQAHQQHGAQWHGPGFHSGYNEVIVNSAHLNRNLPDAIDAFFMIKGKSPVTADLGYGIVIDVVKAHREFLAHYHLDAKHVPLLVFDPWNWNAPFAHAD